MHLDDPDDRLWNFHKKEIDSLNSARIFANHICKEFGRLFEAIREDRPLWGADPVHQLLNHKSAVWHLETHLRDSGHLIDPVGIPTEIPGTSDSFLTSDHARVPTLRVSRKHKSAHRATMAMGHIFKSYFERTTFRLCEHLGLGFNANDACDELIKSHWPQLREELEDVAEFDCDGLAADIESESHAAISRCRETTMAIIAQRIVPKSCASGQDTEWLHRDLRDLSGLSPTSFSNYVRNTRVTPPSKGQCNRRYSDDEARTILAYISANGKEKRIRDRCKTALENHF